MDLFELLVISVAVGAVIVISRGVVPSPYFRRFRSHDVRGASVLMTHYTEGADLIPVKKGKIGHMHYSAVATVMSGWRRDIKIEPALIYRVELPYSSRIHLLGIPKSAGATQIVPTMGKSLMEKVDLEGDYYNYFSLYCEKGMQVETRYVLDPKAMAFTVDFCQSHNWEIIRNELYFLQAGAGAEGDRTTMFEDIERFVEEIRPAVERPLSEAEIKAATPYGEERREQLPCPLCRTDMPNTGRYFACTQGHGILLTGASLSGLVNKKLPQSGYVETKVDREKGLTCPSCACAMSQVGYNGSQIIIDSCPNCPYRWLDASEVAGSVS